MNEIIELPISLDINIELILYIAAFKHEIKDNLKHYHYENIVPNNTINK